MQQTTQETTEIYQAHLHWVIFFWPIVLIIISEVVAYQFPAFRTPSYILSAILLLWCVFLLLTYQFSSVTIKKSQVILRTGLWVRQTVDISLNKIESIDIRQSLLGSVLQYGTLIITGTGGTRQMINYLSKPLTCRRYIEQLLHTT